MLNSEENKGGFELFPIKTPEFTVSVNYYKEYWRIYLENEQLLSGLQETQSECLELQRKINAIQEYYNTYAHSTPVGRRKHMRRCAKEIVKSFVCPYPDCKRSYGSEGSLNLHIKIKHNGGNKTDRIKHAKMMANGETSLKVEDYVLEKEDNEQDSK